jgi:hypothetical protein
MPKKDHSEPGTLGPPPETTHAGHFSSLRKLFPHTKRGWLILAGSAAAVVVVLFAVPYTRYGILGQFIKRPVTIVVDDSRSGKPVTNATVTVGGTTSRTNAKGEVSYNSIPVGGWKVTVSKRYYAALSQTITVPIFGNTGAFQLRLTATGDQVTVKVINKITGQPLANASVLAGGTTATTGTDGQTTVVIAAGSAGVPATITLDSYNSLSVTIKNTQSGITANTFSLVPAGVVFFLDKRTGKINVMKANLDGSSPAVVLTGTGKESDTGTVLLASRDWKYLALLASRDQANKNKLYLIDTASGKLSTMDQGVDYFNLVGWSGDTFVYTSSKDKVINGKYGQVSIKSYYAPTGRSAIIDQNDTQDVSAIEYVQSNFTQPNLIGPSLIYTKFWNSYGYNGPNVPSLAGKTQVFIKAAVDGSGKQTLKSLDATQYQNISEQSDQPDEVYYDLTGTHDNTGDASPEVFYEYKDSSVQQTTTITEDDFNRDFYPTFLLSPSGSQTFWYEPRDGKNTLFTGDAGGGSPKQLATLSDFSPYGWYSDDYVLVSKNKSELYIAPADFSTPPLKITDYHRPNVSFSGYGGGYGGQ